MYDYVCGSVIEEYAEWMAADCDAVVVGVEEDVCCGRSVVVGVASSGGRY